MTSLARTGTLVRLALRRDRIMLPVWIYALTGGVISTAVAFRTLYATPESREELAASVGRNGSLRALYGPLFDPSSIGGLTAWRMEVFGAALAGLMSLIVVVRHTRAEEEAERLELVGAGAVGRHAPLTAALITAVGANLVLALLVSAGLIILGQNAGGSLALGLALAAAGWMFAAFAAVAAQLTESSRTATGIAGGALGLSYLLRAAGDGAGEGGASWLSWLSPIGWTEQIRPFAAERWWVFGLVAAFVAVSAGAAYTLAARRDLGAGFLPTRPGPAQAAPSLRSPLALAWRLQRGTLLGWTSGFLVAGAVFGGIAEGVADLVHGNPQLEELVRRMGGERGLVDSFLASIMGLLGMVAAIYATQATLRLRAEETGQRAEPVLATALTRPRWAGSHLVFPALGTVVLLTAAGLTAGLTHGLRTHDLGAQVPRLIEGALVQAPATWVFAAIAAALYGLAPRITTASWALLAAVLFLGWFGPVLQLHQWAMDVSPFTHIPKIPGAELAATPMVWLVGIAAALTATGLAGFRQRDIG
jgi:ABC-2 type transport system permease protein